MDKKLYILLIMTLMISCGTDHRRNKIFMESQLIISTLERTREATKKYPKSRDEFSADVFWISESNPYMFYFRDVDYKFNGQSYFVYIIARYSAKGADYYTCIKLTDRKIYWKDNCAKPEDKIKDINWDQVNSFVTEMMVTPDGKQYWTKHRLKRYYK